MRGNKSIDNINPQDPRFAGLGNYVYWDRRRTVYDTFYCVLARDDAFGLVLVQK